MTTQTQINRAEMRDAPAERGRRNRPMAAGGASSGTARKEHCCPGTEDLMEAVVERENMLNAFKRVVSNKGSAGVDAMGVDALKPYLQTHWARIKEQLLAGSYQPQPRRGQGRTLVDKFPTKMVVEGRATLIRKVKGSRKVD